MKFSFIHAEKVQFPVAALCRLLGVTRQGYYAHVTRPPCARKLEEAALLERVLDVHRESRETYGSPRVRKELQDHGFAFSKRRIERAMKTLGIVVRPRRRFKTTTVADANYNHPPNTLNREFKVTKPNQRWVTDITYIHTNEGWCYLAAIIDLFSRAVVGWDVHTTLETKLPLAALDMALRHRRPSKGLLHHSDRGCQYTSFEYQGVLSERGIEVSMSRKGNCWDNAVAESFFSTIKAELISRKPWASRDELRAALFEYIETFYNRKRLHSSIGYKSPANFEAECAARIAA